ncbi:MAG: triose-phosphate isomerase [Sandaracinaceae bacterium]|nr:triose-phosphate isomerase [Sandaracinaceae bacterium]
MSPRSQRTPFIAGNWKLHHSVAAAIELTGQIVEAWETLDRAAGPNAAVEVCVAPVATALYSVAQAVADSAIFLAGQNCYHEAQGAFTGEVSPALLRDAGASHCIVGHSERRTLFGETDAAVALKVRALLAAGLVPILCVGETLSERDAGETEAVVLRQLRGALDGLDAAALADLIVAYEPVWAIGTGRTASPADAQAVHAAIRAHVRASFGEPLAEGLRILYGGSVKASNAAELLGQPDIDGALVGGASLTADLFVPIIAAAYPS